MKELGLSIEHSVQGGYYLSNRDYVNGLKTFKKEVQDAPESPTANYYYGRFLLHSGYNPEALKYLKRASALKNYDAEYLFWQGMAYAQLGDNKRENESYRQALLVDENYLQALIYLGHNLLEQKKYPEALAFYSRALYLQSDNATVLYNKAFILQKLKRMPEARLAWKEYLHRYPQGVKGRTAANNLNLLKDYSYRNYSLGARTVTVPKIEFESTTATLTSQGQNSLGSIGSVVAKTVSSKLQIVAYQHNNVDLAKGRAIAIKKYLLKKYPRILAKNIGVSWFATPQYIKIENQKRSLEESIDIFLSRE